MDLIITSGSFSTIIWKVVGVSVVVIVLVVAGAAVVLEVVEAVVVDNVVVEVVEAVVVGKVVGTVSAITFPIVVSSVGALAESSNTGMTSFFLL